MQEEVRGFPGISGSRSYVDTIRMTLAPEVVETRDGPKLGVQALGSGGAFPEHLLSRDLNRACIVFYRTCGFGTEAYEAFRQRVHDHAAQLPAGASLRLNGAFPMFYDSTTLISRTMMTSLACSLAMITLILVFVLRSVRLALICLVPNAVPLLVVAGISGWLGASLHLGILIVFSVGLGLAVDDTIHLMVRFKEEYRFAREVALPVGTRLESRIVWDNSAANARNPVVPPVRVRWGFESLDEMGSVDLRVIAEGDQEQAQASLHQLQAAPIFSISGAYRLAIGQSVAMKSTRAAPVPRRAKGCMRSPCTVTTARLASNGWAESTATGNAASSSAPRRGARRRQRIRRFIRFLPLRFSRGAGTAMRRYMQPHARS